MISNIHNKQWLFLNKVVILLASDKTKGGEHIREIDRQLKDKAAFEFLVQNYLVSLNQFHGVMQPSLFNSKNLFLNCSVCIFIIHV